MNPGIEYLNANRNVCATTHGRNARERTLSQKWPWRVTPKHPRPWVLGLDVGNGGRSNGILYIDLSVDIHTQTAPTAVNCGAEPRCANHMCGLRVPTLFSIARGGPVGMYLGLREVHV